MSNPIFAKQCPKCGKYNMNNLANCAFCNTDLNATGTQKIDTNWERSRKKILIVLAIICIFSILMLIASITEDDNNAMSFFIIALIFCFPSFLACIFMIPESKLIREDLNECINQTCATKKEEADILYDNFIKTFPDKIHPAQLLLENKAEELFCKGRVGIGVIEDTLFIFSTYNKTKEEFIQLIERERFDVNIPFKNIKYYRLHGEITREQHITGGGGGGTSIAGAVIGGAIAGDAGAIIGSRKPTEEIHTYYTTEDHRKTELRYKENDKEVSLMFSFSAFEFFESLFPEKNYDIVQEIKKNSIVQNTASGNIDDITGKIEKLASLKEQGILTEEEFAQKKSELLERI